MWNKQKKIPHTVNQLYHCVGFYVVFTVNDLTHLWNFEWWLPANINGLYIKIIRSHKTTESLITCSKARSGLLICFFFLLFVCFLFFGDGFFLQIIVDFKHTRCFLCTSTWTHSLGGSCTISSDLSEVCQCPHVLLCLNLTFFLKNCC